MCHVRTVHAEALRLIAEDFNLAMPIETRLQLLDMAERIDQMEEPA